MHHGCTPRGCVGQVAWSPQRNQGFALLARRSRAEDGAMPTTCKQWRLLPHDPAAIDNLSRALNLSPIVAQLLHNREVREAEAARRLGLELIVTDHHEPKSQLPAADVVVHPRLHGDGAAYPFGHLSGSGVAFKLAWALSKRYCGSDKVTPQFREFLLDAVT